MKKLVCEMCGSADLIKQDGLFVCQSCGCKYSVEEARKMMIEGTVDVSGSTVKVDDTDRVENYMTIANNAYASGNNVEAEQYCNKAIEADPAHAEAWLLKGIASAWQSTLANPRMEELLTGAQNAFENAQTREELDELAERVSKEFYNIVIALNKLKLDHVVDFPGRDTWMDYIGFPVKYLMWEMQIQAAYALRFNKLVEEIPEEERPKVRNLAASLGLNDLKLRCERQVIDSGVQLWNKALNEYKSSNDGHPTDYALERINEHSMYAMLMMSYVIPSDESKIKEEKKPDIIRACKELITMKKTYMDLKSYQVSFSGGYKSYQVSKFITLEAKKSATEDIRKCHRMIKACNPSYEIPVVADPAPPQTGGCYVATAVYGSYDCPEVWTLRRFRDYELARTLCGRLFIRTYYAVSPTLVRWFGETQWFKRMWRGKLDRLVAKLQRKGFESSPYSDRSW